MLTLESFDQKNGILSFDRDLFLCMIQFIKTNSLRNFVGVSEETLFRKNHNFYHIYRRKFNETPIRKLLLNPHNPQLPGPMHYDNPQYLVSYYKRTAFANYNIGRVVLKEIIFETIFELKLSFIGNFMSVDQLSASMINQKINDGCGIFLSNLVDRYCIRFSEFFCDKDICIDPNLYQNSRKKILTFILDMREGKNNLYFKINDILLRKIICNIPHSQRMIQITLGDIESVTLISTMHLKHLPIDFSKKFDYYSSLTGGLITFHKECFRKNCFNKNY
jgi:hypothetical protein